MDKRGLNEMYGKNIIKLRVELKMSQTELVNRTEYSRTTIQNIESGEKGITTGNLLRLSETLGVEPYELLVDQRNVPQYIYAKLQNLTSRDREMILKLVEFMEHSGGQAVGNETDDQAD